jgi:hypothetical protein
MKITKKPLISVADYLLRPSFLERRCLAIEKEKKQKQKQEEKLFHLKLEIHLFEE